MTSTRTERDSLGEVEVPASSYFGAQTERARRNFPVSGLRFPRRFIAAMGMIKGEAAAVNTEIGAVPGEFGVAIRQAADEVAEGRHDEHFPLDIFQTGSGTSTNMNANEVIANRAIEILGGETRLARVRCTRTITSTPVSHPTTSSRRQSTSRPTAAIVEDLEPALELLAASLERRARRSTMWSRSAERIFRTRCRCVWGRSSPAMRSRCATPWPAGGGQAAAGRAGAGRHRDRYRPQRPAGFADAVIARLAERTGHAFVPAPNRFEALAAKDAAVETSGALKTIAVSLTKVANDIRWLGSGPRCGIGEIALPSSAAR